MASLAVRLIDYLRVGLPMVKIGAEFRVNDGTNWAMSTQKLNGIPTGKIILVCDDTEALEDFTRIATIAGHTVVPAGPRNTILITPA